MTTDHWAPYGPDAARPWNLARVVHLHRRAAFAATWDEFQRDLADGPDAAVGRLLAGTANRHAAADYESTAALLTDAAAGSGDAARLKAAWFYRFLLGPDPLLEKLTLLWHDHFATANGKVDDTGLMRRMVDALRTHARGPFGALLNAAVREPALLLYLDAPANRPGHPNENLARELMELFTLGIGHYTEADVKEAARALTGWTVEDGQFAAVPARHDGKPKTVLGTTANFDGAALVAFLLKQPAVAERIVAKLVRQFFGEAGVPAAAAAQLVAGLRERNLDIGWAVETILRSRLFFDAANLRTRVLSPVEYVVGSARALAVFDPAPSTLAMADWSARMGLDVLDPPNVGGWPGGRKWVHGRGLIARANYAAALVTGPDSGRSVPYDPVAATKAAGFGSADILVYHHRLLFGTDTAADTTARLGSLPPPQLVTALLSSPDAQLG